jgi:hypothetical protein
MNKPHFKVSSNIEVKCETPFHFSLTRPIPGKDLDFVYILICTHTRSGVILHTQPLHATYRLTGFFLVALCILFGDCVIICVST